MVRAARNFASSPETALLLSCARTGMEAARAERIRHLLRQELNWEYLIRLALRHGVMPLLYWNLHTACPDAVPQTVMDRLKRAFHANVFNNLFLTRELLKILALCETHGIPAMPYKGPVLAVAVYGDLSFRQFSDLDILVHERDVQRSKALLHDQGYSRWRQLIDNQDAKSSHAVDFIRDDGRVKIDLHWRFAQSYYSFPLDPETVWTRLEPVSIEGTQVLSLAPEDLLLILCAHGAKDNWARLLWLCDVAELIRRHPDMNWGWVMAQAARLHSERALLLGLYLANGLLETTLPQQVMQRATADPSIQKLAIQVHHQLFSEAEGAIKFVARTSTFLRLKAGWQDRLRYLLYSLRMVFRMTLTPCEQDRAFWQLPASWAFLYYLIRPFRLLGKYSVDFLQGLRERLSRS